MIRTRPGYPHYVVHCPGIGDSRPGLMHYALEVARRMRKRGHRATVFRQFGTVRVVGLS